MSDTRVARRRGYRHQDEIATKRFRAVTDFLDVYWGEWHWPAFNVADIAICLGVFLAGLALLWQGREDDGGK